MNRSLVIVGGGAAGFFAALSAKETNPKNHVLLLEKTNTLLSKVRVSGGGRCNVTHSCFDPKLLIQNYPRGNKELLGPFTRFQPQDTITWFKKRNIELKTESDGRMFPITNRSSTIIDCFISESKRLGIEVLTNKRITFITKENESFFVHFSLGEKLICDKILLATGSSPQGHAIAEGLGHTIQKPVPSLFTFNIANFSLKECAGISLENVMLKLGGTSVIQHGPLLITHWGFSGPAALKLSAWDARYLFEKNYHADLIVDWIPEISKEELLKWFQDLRKENPHQLFVSRPPYFLPKNLWKQLCETWGISPNQKMGETNNPSLLKISTNLKNDLYKIEGKTVHKEEFVTCGGITLSEVNFKTMESKKCPGLFFAGEILDIDAVTGGFNFQNAWTTGWIAGHAMGEEK